ncbi:MAG TPA: ABC transporter permease [Thermoanaerobaculia bacterium]|nr:ABC transporter permease [Thermoanaerobaculia bacterium]
MTNFASLVENETIKMIRRRRFAIVLTILVSILSVIAYSQYRQLEKRTNRDWRAQVQQQITRYENMLRRDSVNASWARSLRAEKARLQFYLDHDIDPDRPTAPLFARTFANAAGFLLLPLLIAVLGSDIVSAENAEGTDKLLLTRPVRRWKILASKLMSLYIFTTLTLLLGGLLAYGVSALVLEPRGWEAPVFSGFQVSERGNLTFEAVRQLPLWKDTLIAYGLGWFALIVVASISLMLSVLFKSSAASMGAMLSALIGGTILSRISPDWTAAKYLFVSALPLADYYSGQAPPYDGMSLLFCIALLGAWAIGALVVAFTIFTRRDVFG